MPTAREYLDEQAALAQAGNRSSLNSVAVAVSPWTRGQARRLAAKFSPVEASDAFGEAMLVLSTAVRCWKPERGGFLNYFAFVASRRICKWAKREQRRHFPPLDLYEPADGWEEREPDTPPKLVALLDELPPPVRAVFVRRHGIDGHERADIDGIAVALDTTPASVRRRLTIAATVVRWHARGLCGTSAVKRTCRPSTVRPPSPAKKALAEYFARPNAAEESNRVIARVIGLDERTVRNYRHRHGIPSLPQHRHVRGSSAHPEGTMTTVQDGREVAPTGADYPRELDSLTIA